MQSRHDDPTEVVGGSFLFRPRALPMLPVLVTLAVVFTAVMVAITWGFVRTLRRERAEAEERQR